MILPASPDICNGKNSVEMIHKDDTTDTERRRDGDIESSVSIQEDWMRSIKNNTLTNDD